MTMNSLAATGATAGLPSSAFLLKTLAANPTSTMRTGATAGSPSSALLRKTLAANFTRNAPPSA